jgi:cytochrome bd-type quinol oxidase subunit 2
MQNKSHINKGLVIAAILICFNIVTQFTKTYFDEWTTFVFAAIIIVGVGASVFLLNKQDETGASTFGSAFTYGFKTAAVVACVYFIYNILAVYIFFPNFIDEKLRRGIEEAKKIGSFDDSTTIQNSTTLNPLGRKVIIYTHFAGAIMATLFLGIIGSLIGAVSIKKTNNI